MDAITRRLSHLIETFQSRAAALELRPDFPSENIADMHRIGALAAPLPRALGGIGAGTEPAGATEAMQMLRLLGRAHLPTGRLFEAHVNALKLVATYGTPAQHAKVALACKAGHLHALWVTDGAQPVRLADGVLHGGKAFCSGAGHLTHAVVTAQPEAGAPVLVLVTLDGRPRARPGAQQLQGMRAAITGAVDLTGLAAPPEAIIGTPGDYLRQPEFSAGAWRTAAVTTGGIEALVDFARRELRGRGRDADPHQRARVGRMLIAQETCLLWIRRAALMAESPGQTAGDVAATVNLARIAVEHAGLDIIRLVTSSLGLAAFVQGHPAERLLRDLATYLRQPAPDETLTEAACWFMDRDPPDPDSVA